MPVAPLKPCAWPRCPALTAQRYCEQHRRSAERARGSAAARGYDAAWRRVRELKLARDPLCECDDCQAGKLKVTAATVVDHIVAITAAPERRLDFANLRSMAKACHDRRTARDQGFARRGR